MKVSSSDFTSSQRIKLRVIWAAGLLTQLVTLWVFLYAALALPLAASLTIWAIGAIISHITLFQTMVRPRGESLGLKVRFVMGLRSYVQDSGIPLIVLGWPLWVAMTSAPEIIEGAFEKLFGIEWREGIRTFR